jgi:2,5-diketo-D-gluconate reductase B
MPRLGFGTYGRRGKDGIAAIRFALEIGFRHLDTAQTYDTEWEVGEAVRQSGLARTDLFLTTKISTENYGEGQVVESLKRSLETLGVDRVDLALLHWPSPCGRQPLAEYLMPLLEAQQLGLTRYAGVSNFTIELLEQVAMIAGPGRIVNNQVELNPFIQNRKLARYCQQNEITVTCYQPIAKGRLRGDPVLEAIASECGASVEQVAIAFELAKGYASIPTSGRPDRIRSNYAAKDLVLTAEQVARIELIDRHERSVDPDWGPEWDGPEPD